VSGAGKIDGVLGGMRQRIKRKKKKKQLLGVGTQEGSSENKKSGEKTQHPISKEKGSIRKNIHGCVDKETVGGKKKKKEGRKRSKLAKTCVQKGDWGGGTFGGAQNPV